MKTIHTKQKTLRDEAADVRISVFFIGGTATVKVRRRGKTSYHNVAKADALSLIFAIRACSAV